LTILTLNLSLRPICLTISVGHGLFPGIVFNLGQGLRFWFRRIHYPRLRLVLHGCF
jgi:hypothetical protein